MNERWDGPFIIHYRIIVTVKREKRRVTRTMKERDEEGEYNTRKRWAKWELMHFLVRTSSKINL